LLAAILLAVAVALVWSVEGQLDAASNDRVGQSVAAQAQNHLARKVGAHPALSGLPAHCQTADVGCCMMSLCHPGVASDAAAAVLTSLCDATEETETIASAGRSPGVDVPPPRILLV
jgi:hypothetical protein